jgi:hypothetical protein
LARFTRVKVRDYRERMVTNGEGKAELVIQFSEKVFTNGKDSNGFAHSFPGVWHIYTKVFNYIQNYL